MNETPTTTPTVDRDPKALVKIFGFLRKDVSRPLGMVEMKEFWHALTPEEKDRFSHEVDQLQPA